MKLSISNERPGADAGWRLAFGSIFMAIGFSLEFTTGFPAQVWTADTNIPSIIGDQFAVIVDSTLGQRFYRLRSP